MMAYNKKKNDRKEISEDCVFQLNFIILTAHSMGLTYCKRNFITIKTVA